MDAQSKMGVQFRWPARDNQKQTKYFSYLTVQIVGALINLGFLARRFFFFRA